METLKSNIAEWGIETRSVGGEFGCGDDALIHWHLTGGLVAVVDGLGHGPSASMAAHAALDAIRVNPDDPPGQILARCHEATRRTRGLTMAIASIDAQQGQMTWFGVGNVHGTLVRSAPGHAPVRESLLVRSGVVGHRIPPIVPTIVPLEAGDILALATDGIRSGFETSILPEEGAQAAAARILACHGRPTDDALIVVVRYRGLS